MTPPPAPLPDGPLYLFDGACVLCSGTVRFLLRHEADQRMRFCAVQSPAGQALLASLGMDAMPDTFLFIDDGTVYQRSAAAFRLARHLKAPWRWLRVLSLLPRGLTDRAYDWVARHRYRIFGRHEVCLVPEPGQRGRFL
ncbi:thiol-disulfide oxidoreductase DCC family protein [Aerophototrophica crusticola]|uniref:Thiol-disulfide oxidoreductase DCC family protein n=1 Tax=Aerophototrophica crusticola TaxID=1709002 RepID=A0A858RB28_9PROT|nr:thiol-disulfide oxidoreductase DCC family protein [Rhodospirillaceae bacterium B3]